MDAGNRRGPSTGSRMINSNPEPYRQPAGQHAPQSAPQPAQPRPVAPAQAQPAKARKEGKRFKLPLILILVLVVLGAAGWFGYSALSGGGLAIDSSKYQAIIISNNQHYFGKLENHNAEFFKLTDVWYAQKNTSTGADATQQSDSGAEVNLVKLGQEIHGPEDAMYISKDQVLYYENLKSDGKVTQAIERYKNSN